MKTQITEDAPETTLPQDIANAARFCLQGLRQRVGRRMGLIAAMVLVVGLGLAFNWSWLVAVGVAPLLVTALPCVAMCALGLCMNRGAGRSSSDPKDRDDPSNRRVAPPVQPAANTRPRYDESDDSHPRGGPATANDSLDDASDGSPIRKEGK